MADSKYYSKERLTPQTRLANILESQGYRHCFVAKKIKYGRRYMSSIINGHLKATDNFKKAMAEFLNMPIDVVFPQEGS